MKKVLVSWIATNHDFLHKNEIGEIVQTKSIFNENGPHFSLYKDFGDDYDTHYLLSQHNHKQNSDPRLEQLAGTLRNKFNTRVILKYMDINDILSVGTIKGAIEQLVKFQLKDQEVEVFVSPGSPSMQIAWYMLGSDLYKRENILFFRRRERKYIENSGIPPKEPIDFDGSNYAKVSNVRDNHKDGNVISDKDTFITSSYKEIYKKALQLSGNHNSTILIQGELGTGKTHLAKYIHYHSNRKSKPLMTFNCASHRGDVLENRLFGYEIGAFEGAKKLTTGVFEHVRSGTLVLEEVDRLPLHVQVQLSELLKSKTLRRLGSNKDLTLDVRIIATTTKDLWKLCQEEVFRMDLYYRLTVSELALPSFTQINKVERKEWINYFMKTTYTKLEKRYIKHIDKKVWEILLNHPFFGNLQELKNIVEEFYTFCDDKVTIEDIPNKAIREQENSSLLLEDIIKKHVEMVVNRCGGVKKHAAELMGINRGTVTKYLK